MIILPISPHAGEEIAKVARGFSNELGLWALPVWIVCGGVGFSGIVLFGWIYEAGIPDDGISWFLAALMFASCLLFGPFSIACGPVMIGAFMLFNWMGGQPIFG